MANKEVNERINPIIIRDEENGTEYTFTEIYDKATGDEAEGLPDKASYGIFIKSVKALLEPAFENAPSWLHGLVFDGIIGGVGAVIVL